MNSIENVGRDRSKTYPTQIKSYVSKMSKTSNKSKIINSNGNSGVNYPVVARRSLEDAYNTKDMSPLTNTTLCSILTPAANKMLLLNGYYKKYAFFKNVTSERVKLQNIIMIKNGYFINSQFLVDLSRCNFNIVTREKQKKITTIEDYAKISQHYIEKGNNIMPVISSICHQGFAFDTLEFLNELIGDNYHVSNTSRYDITVTIQDLPKKSKRVVHTINIELEISYGIYSIDEMGKKNSSLQVTGKKTNTLTISSDQTRKIFKANSIGNSKEVDVIINTKSIDNGIQLVFKEFSTPKNKTTKQSSNKKNRYKENKKEGNKKEYFFKKLLKPFINVYKVISSYLRRFYFNFISRER